jgi:hypothetical protein
MEVPRGNQTGHFEGKLFVRILCSAQGMLHYWKLADGADDWLDPQLFLKTRDEQK